MSETKKEESLVEQYAHCNLLLPYTTAIQINPYFKCAVSEITVDASESSGEIFNVGRTKTGTDSFGRPIYENLYSLSKPVLMRIATAAGIQFHPEYTCVIKEDANTYVGKAYGAVRLPDGTYKTYADTKRICLDDEEAKMRIEYMDKSIQGIPDGKAAQEAAKMFQGEWKDIADDENKRKSVKYYVISDTDREKYIERSVLVSMTLLRKSVSEKAQTGAILRVIRALLGIKGTYTMQELKKPFAILSVNFQPDYTDVKVKNALLQQGMRSMGSLFGSGSVPEAVTAFSANSFLTTPSEVIAEEEGFESVEDEENPFLDSNDAGEEEKIAETETEKPQKAKSEKKPTEPGEKKTVSAKKETGKKTESTPKPDPVRLTVKEAKQMRIPDSDPMFAGMTLEKVVNEPNGIEYLEQLKENKATDVKLAQAANLILQAIAYIKKQQMESKAS